MFGLFRVRISYLMLLHVLWLDRSQQERRGMCCHNSYWSCRSLLVREVKMSVNIPRLAATVSMLHECRRLLWMAPSRGVHMVGMWSRRTCWTVVNTAVLRSHFRVWRCRIWRIDHDICHCWRNMLIDHPRDVNFVAAAALRTVTVFILRSSFVGGVRSTRTVCRAAGLWSSFSRKIHI